MAAFKEKWQRPDNITGMLTEITSKYGARGCMGLFGQVRANILLQCALQIWSKRNTFQISPFLFSKQARTSFRASQSMLSRCTGLSSCPLWAKSGHAAEGLHKTERPPRRAVSPKFDLAF
jgi:hypothetical protein